MMQLAVDEKLSGTCTIMVTRGRPPLALSYLMYSSPAISPSLAVIVPSGATFGP